MTSLVPFPGRVGTLEQIQHSEMGEDGSLEQNLLPESLFLLPPRLSSALKQRHRTEANSVPTGFPEDSRCHCLRNRKIDHDFLILICLQRKQKLSNLS